MCPLCIGTTAWLISGGTSAGGLAALALKLRGRRKQKGRHSPDDADRVSADHADRHLVFPGNASDGEQRRA